MSIDHALRAATAEVVNRLNEYGVTLDAYAAFVVMDALESHVIPAVSKHDQLVTTALGNQDVMRYVREGKKINAIKELRQRTSCGLKEAKEAVEDSRVWDTYANSSPASPWWESDPTEPPF